MQEDVDPAAIRKRKRNDDLIEGTTFENLAEFQDELMQCLLYYNTERPHQGPKGHTPIQALQNQSTNLLTFMRE